MVEKKKKKKKNYLFYSFDESLKLDPKNSIAWNNKGFVFKNLKQYEEAIKW